ncbi:MAG: cation transporter [Thermoflexales bacterium]|nr:cation transporter [Thermoflexales bacterium]
MDRSFLKKFAWLSIGAAVATITLKSLAYLLTGSVGLLSDAAESIVNLIGAIVALIMLTIAARPADDDHAFGHSKAEYFSSGIEGVLIVIAAISIAATAIERLANPQPLEQAGIGLLVAVVASAINFSVARVLAKAGKQYNSITLEADAKHLMTDVWTSAGVITAVAAVAITNWLWLDSIIALAVAVNILWSAYGLIKRSAQGLMDSALPAEEQAAIKKILTAYTTPGVQFHAVRTRQAAARRFVSFHVMVPGSWPVQQGHDLLEKIEQEIRAALPDVTLNTHLEPVEDPVSLADAELDRAASGK